jgi:hypothetical protein
MADPGPSERSRGRVDGPAFYALPGGGWRDYWTLLHPPYTVWHLSYVAIGAALAPRLDWELLGWTVLAFFLAMGVGAHALDELRSRPLQTRIGASMLVALAVISLLAAVAIGVGTALETDLWLLAFVAGGAFVAVAYNLELFGGRFHGTLWFALAWGALPVLATFFAVAHAIRPEAAAAAVFAAVLSWVQRVLSTPVRAMRRQEGRLAGSALDAERALRLLSVAMVALAVALVLTRVT